MTHFPLDFLFERTAGLRGSNNSRSDQFTLFQNNFYLCLHFLSQLTYVFILVLNVSFDVLDFVITSFKKCIRNFLKFLILLWKVNLYFRKQRLKRLLNWLYQINLRLHLLNLHFLKERLQILLIIFYQLNFWLLLFYFF